MVQVQTYLEYQTGNAVTDKECHLPPINIFSDDISLITAQAQIFMN